MQQQPSFARGLDDDCRRVSASTSAILRKRPRLLLMVGVSDRGVGALLAIGLPDVYRSSGLIEIEGAQNMRRAPDAPAGSIGATDEPLYADQYVQSLGTVVLSDKNLTQLLQSTGCTTIRPRIPRGSIKRLAATSTSTS